MSITIRPDIDGSAPPAPQSKRQVFGTASNSGATMDNSRAGVFTGGNDRDGMKKSVERVASGEWYKGSRQMRSVFEAFYASLTGDKHYGTNGFGATFGFIGQLARRMPAPILFDDPKIAMFIFGCKTEDELSRKATAAMDNSGRMWMWAPFFEEMLREEARDKVIVTPVMVHEYSHIALNHPKRMHNFPHGIANDAADKVINPMAWKMFDAKVHATFSDIFKLGHGNRPEDKRFEGKSEETIAKMLMLEMRDRLENQGTIYINHLIIEDGPVTKINKLEAKKGEIKHLDTVTVKVQDLGMMDRVDTEFICATLEIGKITNRLKVRHRPGAGSDGQQERSPIEIPVASNNPSQGQGQGQGQTPGQSQGGQAQQQTGPQQSHSGGGSSNPSRGRADSNPTAGNSDDDAGRMSLEEIKQQLQSRGGSGAGQQNDAGQQPQGAGGGGAGQQNNAGQQPQGAGGGGAGQQNNAGQQPQGAGGGGAGQQNNAGQQPQGAGGGGAGQQNNAGQQPQGAGGGGAGQQNNAGQQPQGAGGGGAGQQNNAGQQPQGAGQQPQGAGSPGGSAGGALGGSPGQPNGQGQHQNGAANAGPGAQSQAHPDLAMRGTPEDVMGNLVRGNPLNSDGGHLVDINKLNEHLRSIGYEELLDKMRAHDFTEDQVERAVEIALKEAAKERLIIGSGYAGGHVEDYIHAVVRPKSIYKVNVLRRAIDFLQGCGSSIATSMDEYGILSYVEPADMGFGDDDGVYYPGNIAQKPEGIYGVIIDTSGSIWSDKRRLGHLASLALGIRNTRDEMSPDVLIVGADTVVSGVPRFFDEESILEAVEKGLPVGGGGGTDYEMPINQFLAWCKKEQIKVNGLVYLGDFEVNPPRRENLPEDCPPLFFVGMPQDVVRAENFVNGVQGFAEVGTIEDDMLLDAFAAQEKADAHRGIGHNKMTELSRP